MVLYFTGTGNSCYIAEKIAGKLGDELLCINDRIKKSDRSPIDTGSDVVIVAPTYAWRLPKIVSEWTLQTEFRGAERIWFVMNCGGGIGNAAKYNERLSREKSLRYMGTAEILMPENYIAMFSVPEKEEAEQIVAEADPVIERAIQKIAGGEAFAEKPAGIAGRIMSGPVNKVFYPFCVKAKAFAAGDGCIGCGKCVKLCPLNNIALRQGKPVWGKNCTHCMACIAYCPTEAIEYGRKSAGKPRYHLGE